MERPHLLQFNLLELVGYGRSVVHSFLIVTGRPLVPDQICHPPPHRQASPVQRGQVQPLVLAVRQTDRTGKLSLEGGMGGLVSPYVGILIKVNRSLQHQEADVKLDCPLASPDEEPRVRSGLSVDGLAHKQSTVTLV